MKPSETVNSLEGRSASVISSRCFQTGHRHQVSRGAGGDRLGLPAPSVARTQYRESSPASRCLSGAGTAGSTSQYGLVRFLRLGRGSWQATCRGDLRAGRQGSGVPCGIHGPEPLSCGHVEDVRRDANVYTNCNPAYRGLPRFEHGSLKHSAGEYVRGFVHTNGISPSCSLLKRGYVGVFHYMYAKYLFRYVNEFAGQEHAGHTLAK